MFNSFESSSLALSVAGPAAGQSSLEVSSSPSQGISDAHLNILLQLHLCISVILNVLLERFEPFKDHNVFQHALNILLENIYLILAPYAGIIDRDPY